MDAFLAESPDAARGERHQFLVRRVVADPPPALHDLGSYLVDPFVGNDPDHTGVAQLATHGELDHQVWLVPLAFDVEAVLGGE